MVSNVDDDDGEKLESIKLYMLIRAVGYIDAVASTSSFLFFVAFSARRTLRLIRSCYCVSSRLLYHSMR